MKLSEQIKFFREQRGLSRAEVARLAGINYSTYNGYEIENKNPSLGNLTKIAKVLSVSMDDLLFTDYIDPLDELIPIIEKSGFSVSSFPSHDGSIEMVELVYLGGGAAGENLLYGESSLMFEKENFINFIKKSYENIRKNYEQQLEQHIKTEMFYQICSMSITERLAPCSITEEEKILASIGGKIIKIPD